MFLCLEERRNRALPLHVCCTATRVQQIPAAAVAACSKGVFLQRSFKNKGVESNQGGVGASGKAVKDSTYESNTSGLKLLIRIDLVDLGSERSNCRIDSLLGTDSY